MEPETDEDLQPTEEGRVYCDAHDEWLAIGGRDSGARTTAEHVYLRIAAHVRRQAAAELAAVAERRCRIGKGVLLEAGQLITPGTATRIIEQRRGTIGPDR